MSANGSGAAKSRFTLLAAVAFLVGLAISGGAAASNEPLQIMARLVAIATVLALQFVSADPKAAALKSAWIGLAAAAALVVLQLVPLPAALWSILPGRAVFLEAAILAGVEQPWRPLAILPDLAVDTLLALLFPLAALAILARLPEERQPHLALAIIGIAIFSAILGLAQLAAGEPEALRLYNLTNTNLPVGLFTNRNHQAVFLALGIAVVVFWLIAVSTRAAYLAIAACVIVLFIYLIILTGSRSGALIGGATFIASAAWFLTARMKRAPNRLRYLCAMGFLAIIVAVGISVQETLIVRRLSSWSSNELRIQTLPVLVQVAANYFPFGAGFGSFDTVYRMAEPFDLLQQEYLNHAHNDFLELIIEGGLPAAIGLSVFLGVWTWRFVAIWRMRRQTVTHQLGRLGSIMTASLLLASLVDYPLRTPMLATLFAIGCGWMEFAFRARVARARSS